MFSLVGGNVLPNHRLHKIIYTLDEKGTSKALPIVIGAR
jgi:hypothetical protein